MARPRVLLAGLFHETHCFTDDVTRIADFRIHRGDALLDHAGDGSQIAGFLEVAAREGWEVIPTSSWAATPSGIAEDAAFEAFWTEVAPAIRAGGYDAIFLSLHGAMVTTGQPDVEGELLRRIRAVPAAQEVPVFGVFDLHATFTADMARHADGLVCYRENPHIDAHNSAVRAAELLARCLRTGIRPRQHAAITGILWPPTGTGTADRPMRALEQQAREIERTEPGVLAVNVVAGFAYADAPGAGVAFGIVTEGEAPAAIRALERLSQSATAMQAEGYPAELDPDEVLAGLPDDVRGPVLLVEPADNIGGGAPGDCTDVLRALLRHDARGAAIVIADPVAIAALASTPVGGCARIAVGGRGSALDPGPVELDVTLLSRSQGRFTLEDRNSHLVASMGVNIDMGPCIVVRHRGITLLLTTRKTPPFDLGQLRSQGIVPEAQLLIVVKAAVAHRRAYDPIAKASYTLRTSGPCTSDLARLPYRRARPILPDAASPG
jgi:microcystin degradation protein MlrC